jgi:hypothetical protein
MGVQVDNVFEGNRDKIRGGADEDRIRADALYRGHLAGDCEIVSYTIRGLVDEDLTIDLSIANSGLHAAGQVQRFVRPETVTHLVLSLSPP